MTDILKLSLSFALMVVLLRRKHKVGLVMLIGAVTLGAFYLMPPREALGVVKSTLANPVTLELVLALSFIRMMEMVLREHGLLTRMMDSFKRAFSSRRAVLVSMPLLIGMLPSVGGAYFSAPMVEEAARGHGMPAHEKAFVNYWFRHPWEFVLPLYPGILLASALGGVDIRTLMLHNLLPAALMFGMGFIVSMRNLKGERGRSRAGELDLWSFVPIGLVLLMVIALGLKLYISLGLVVVGMMVFYRYGAGRIWKLLRYGFSLDVVLLIFGVMLFKETMETTGAVASISALFADAGIPLMPTLIVIPFVAGMLTGITIGYVGATFPLVASLAGGASPHALALAFTAGFAGVLLSPVHVCLILTREYFSARMAGIYARMYLPVAVTLLAASALYLILS